MRRIDEVCESARVFYCFLVYVTAVLEPGKQASAWLGMKGMYFC